MPINLKISKNEVKNDFASKKLWEREMSSEEFPVPFSLQANSLEEGSIYEHYKGNRYKILCVGRHSETLEESVVYQAQYGNGDVWIRPLWACF